VFDSVVILGFLKENKKQAKIKHTSHEEQSKNQAEPILILSFPA